jgi:hypothetical protein
VEQLHCEWTGDGHGIAVWADGLIQIWGGSFTVTTRDQAIEIAKALLGAHGIKLELKVKTILWDDEADRMIEDRFLISGYIPEDENGE